MKENVTIVVSQRKLKWIEVATKQSNESKEMQKN
jgi:hypothetical protein